MTSETFDPLPVEPPEVQPGGLPDDPPGQSKLPPGARAFFDWLFVIAVALLVAFVVIPWFCQTCYREGVVMKGVEQD